jgi:beta-glucosidase
VLDNLQTSQASLSLEGSLSVSVDVTNSGERAGDEVVQVYVRHPGSAVARPDKALKGFRRVSLAAGETRRVEIPLVGLDLAYWNVETDAWALESGPLELMVGTSSRDADLPLRRRITTLSS